MGGEANLLAESSGLSSCKQAADCKLHYLGGVVFKELVGFEAILSA